MKKLQTPKNWRKGQSIFNFLEWLKIIKKYPSNQSDRLADPFHIPDTEMNTLYTEFLKEQKNQLPEDLSTLDTNEI